MSEEVTEHTTQRQNMATMDVDYIKLRLDTQKLHQDILNFLEGTRTVVQYDPATNQYTETVQQYGVPLANKTGIQQLLSFIICIINPHTIQGNTNEKDFYPVLHDLEEGLIDELTQNYEEWGIQPDNRAHILKTLMSMIRFILSRTVGNLERPSYSPTIEKTSKYFSNNKKSSGVI